MQALLEDMKTGQVAAYDVPAPELQPGGLLVRTAFSAISAGTEKATVQAGRRSLLSKALARPDLASLTTIGAIAIQGVRQANVTFGETVAVIGAGLVGVLTVALI